MADRIGQMVRDHPCGVMLTVLVTPGASRNEVVGPHGAYLRVRIAAPAEGGRANRATVRLLSEVFRCRADLLSGATGRIKRVLLRDADRTAVTGVMEALAR